MKPVRKQVFDQRGPKGRAATDTTSGRQRASDHQHRQKSGSRTLRIRSATTPHTSRKQHHVCCDLPGMPARRRSATRSGRSLRQRHASRRSCTRPAAGIGFPIRRGQRKDRTGHHRPPGQPAQTAGPRQMLRSYPSASRINRPAFVPDPVVSIAQSPIFHPSGRKAMARAAASNDDPAPSRRRQRRLGPTRGSPPARNGGADLGPSRRRGDHRGAPPAAAAAKPAPGAPPGRAAVHHDSRRLRDHQGKGGENAIIPGSRALHCSS